MLAARAHIFRPLRLIAYTLTALCTVMPSGIQAQTVSANHPRMWITPTRLARMRTFAARNTQRWQRVKNRADYIVGNSGMSDMEGMYLPVLGLAYQVTGDTRYSDRAATILTQACVPSNTLTTWSWHPYRMVIPNVAAGFDWCYDRLSPALRQQVAGWLMDRADAVWEETNPARSGAWGLNEPANNYFWGFMMTWVGSLAAYGHDPVTSGTVSSPNRPQYHLNLALSKYRNMARPILDGWCKGGIFAEGSNYDSSSRVAMQLDAHLTATGQDLINETGFNFLKESLYYRFYSTSPTMEYKYPLGDQSSNPSGTMTDYDRERGYIPMDGVADTQLKRYTKFWLDNMDPNISYWEFIVGWEFLYYDEDALSSNTSALPLGYFAEGPGLYLRRSSWVQDATWWGVWSGPLMESHQSRDVNGFKIYKGGWLVGDASIWGNSGIHQETPYHNNLTFGTYDQEEQRPNAAYPDHAGRVLKLEDAAGYSYFAGWGAQAYTNDRTHGGTKIADDYVRKIAWISPDIFFIYDRVRLVNGTLAKNWHLQARNAITVNGRSYSFDNGVYRLTGHSVAPSDGVAITTAAVVNSQRVTVTTSRGQQLDHMLNVLRITPVSSASPAAPQSIVSDQGNMEGAAASGWVVLFGKSDAVAAPVNYSSNIASATEHLLLDLAPNTRYPVSIRNTATGNVTTSDVTSSSQGSLRFSVAGGAHTIGIGTGAANASPPTLTTLSPTSVTAGSAAFTLTVNGTGFVSGAAVKWNGAAKATTFVSSTRVTAAISAADIANAGTAQVVATNPGSIDSNALSLSINAPPTYTLTASPATVNAGANMSVTWTAPPGSSSTDWIGLFKVGAQSNMYVWWAYTSGLASGTHNVTAPNSPGQYEFRYYLNNGYTLAKTSNAVTVNAGYSLAATPTSVNGGQNVTVSWTAPAGSSAVDWIGLFPASGDNRSYVWFRHTNGAASGSFTVVAPSEPGQYQFRYLLNNGYVDAARSNNITVAASYSVSASPANVSAGGKVTVTYTAPSGASTTDWIGLYRVGAASGQFAAYKYTGGGTSGTMEFTMPSAAGDYEFRYFVNNSYTEKARSSTVTVKSHGLVATPATVARGGQITVTWTAPTGAATSDWIALYRVGDPNTTYGAWFYTNGATSGNRAVTAPNVAGQYEFRYLLNGGYTEAVRSNPVTVN